MRDRTRRALIEKLTALTEDPAELTSLLLLLHDLTIKERAQLFGFSSTVVLYAAFSVVAITVGYLGFPTASIWIMVALAGDVGLATFRQIQQVRRRLQRPTDQEKIESGESE